MAISARSPYLPTLIGLGFAASVGLTLFPQIGCKSSRPLPTAKAPPTANGLPEESEAAATISPPPSPASPQPTIACAANQVPIPGGTFWLGDEEIGRHAHQVTLASYCMDKTKVTVAAFRACVQAHKCRPPSATVDWKGITPKDKAKWSQFCNWGKRGFDQHPMNCVDWDQATEYCAATGGRLPTEDEWEYAACGNDDRIFPWGKQPPDVTRLNACGGECASMAKERFDENWETMYTGDDGWTSTSPVGNYPKGASPFGILDMAGNVWEWTVDIFSVNDQGPGDSPRGPQPNTPYRTIRGGGWNSNAAARVRTASADGNGPDSRNFSVGFRCARGVKNSDGT